MVLMTEFLNEIRDASKTEMGVICTQGGIGQDNTAAAASDTALGDEVFRDARDDFDTFAANTAVVQLRVYISEANGNAIKEVGWFNNDNTFVDNCDDATNWTANDSADMTTSDQTTTYKEGGTAMNLTKDGTASVNASTFKTTTSGAFISSNSLQFWIYIADTATLNKLAATDGLTIRFGSDGSNYYVWTKDRTDLSVGWNQITSLTAANADSTTGTPDTANMDYTFIQLTTNNAADVWTAGGVIIDNIRTEIGTLYTHNIITTINKTSDIQLFLDTQATFTVTEDTS